MTVNIHATCVRLARAAAPFGARSGTGILILGESGSGKSDLALRLIERGARLVADDRTDLSVERGWLYGRPPRTIAGLIEIRGLGIVELPHDSRVRVSLVVQLDAAAKRFPERAVWHPPAGLELTNARHPPLITVNPFEASAPAKVVAAAAAFASGLFREEVKKQ